MLITRRVPIQLGFIDALVSGLVGLVVKPSTQSCPVPPPPPWYGTSEGAVGVAVGGAAVGALLVMAFGGKR